MIRLRRLCVALVATGCSTIPVIRFSTDASDDSTVGTDGAMIVEAGSEADAGLPIEGSIDAPNACPSVVPDGAVACCGSIACGNAYCSQAACIVCQMKCASNSLCCPNMGGMQVSCVTTGKCP